MKIIGIKGFTLVELMVTIVVLAIIAMMAAPTFRSMIETQNLNQSTQELVAQLTQARSKAILERRSIDVKLSTAVPTTPVADTPSILNWNPQGAAILKTGSPTTITFLLSGSVKDFDANIRNKPFIVCNKNGGNKSKSISISLMGTVQVTEGTCS